MLGMTGRNVVEDNDGDDEDEDDGDGDDHLIYFSSKFQELVFISLSIPNTLLYPNFLPSLPSH